MFKRISNYFNPPKNLNVFNIPVLIKKEVTTYFSYTAGREVHTEYTEAYTDGFYYISNGIKFFRVKEQDKEPVYYKRSGLVFLTEEESNASRTVDN